MSQYQYPICFLLGSSHFSEAMAGPLIPVGVPVAQAVKPGDPWAPGESSAPCLMGLEDYLRDYL